MRLTRLLLSVLVSILLLSVPPVLSFSTARCPSPNGVVSRGGEREGSSCDSRLAFVLFGTGRGSDGAERHRDALIAAYTLAHNGLWQGMIVIASGCDAPLPEEFKEVEADVRIVARPQYAAAAGTTGVASQAARVAEVFRLLPSSVELAVILDDHVRIGAPVGAFVTYLLRQRQSRSPTEPHSFIAAFLSQWTGLQTNNDDTLLPLSPAVTVLDRLYSASCLRASQVQVAMMHSAENAPIAVRRESERAAKRYATLGVSASDASQHTVIYPGACQPQELDASWLLQASSFSVLTRQRGVFIALPSAKTDRHAQAQTSSQSGTEGPDPVFDVSDAQQHAFLAETLHVPQRLYKDSSIMEMCTPGGGGRPRTPAPAADEDTLADDASPSRVGNANAEGDAQKAVAQPDHAPCDPQIAVAGCAKCATTTLHSWLTTHPNIVRPWQKEPNYDFAPGDTSSANAYLADLRFGNRNLQSGDTRRRLTIDGSTHLLWNMTHVTNLRRFCPSVKTIVVVCDPVSRALSHWNYRRFVWEWAFLEDKTVDDIVRRQLAEMPDWVSKADYTVPTSTMVDFELDGDDSQGVWTLVREGLYAIALKRFLTVFPKDQLLVINRDDMKSDPVSVLRKVEAFLGIPAHQYDDSLLHRRSNVNAHRKEVFAEDVRRALTEFYKPHNEELRRMEQWRRAPWS